MRDAVGHTFSIIISSGPALVVIDRITVLAPTRAQWRIFLLCRSTLTKHEFYGKTHSGWEIHGKRERERAYAH